MEYPIKEIRANPFRHIDRYPIRRDKVEALKESLRTTGFWGNVIARVRDGKPEIAYGHHRLVALREEYGPGRKVDLIVRDLNDDAMLKIMARENMEEWGTSAAVEHETIRAVVEAYGAGLIQLPDPNGSTTQAKTRWAPSFIPGDVRPPGVERAYTAQTLAEYLGWLKPSGDPQAKVRHALAALQFIEEGILTETDFEGLTTKQAEAVVEQARKAKADREAAARVAQREAEQAERDAREAERRRVKAEQDRIKAKEEPGRQRAEREAAQAEETKRTAERRQQVARQREGEERERGRRQATTTGRHVSKSLKSGARGYKQAGEAAAEVREEPLVEKPPPHIDDFARRLATDLNRILDPDRDDRAKKLDDLVRFGSEMTASSLRELIAELQGIAGRANGYAERLMNAGRAPATTTVQQTERRALPSSGRRA